MDIWLALIAAAAQKESHFPYRRSKRRLPGNAGEVVKCPNLLSALDNGRKEASAKIRETLFDNVIEIPGHDITLRLLDNILEDYRKACYATGKQVEQPHLKDVAKRAIQELSPFYSPSDADRLLERAVASRLRRRKYEESSLPPKHVP
jgi:hypothetical protein